MATRGKSDAVPAPGKAKPARSARKPASSARGKALFDVQALRHTYGLGRAVFARMLGTDEVTLEGWETGKGTPDRSGLTRIERLGAILGKASAVMRPTYIPTWVERASPACAELGAHAPVDLMERGDYDVIEDLLFYLGSGVPF